MKHLKENGLSNMSINLRHCIANSIIKDLVKRKNATRNPESRFEGIL
jgi:hypothetical protein